jgi:putative hemolysin
MHIVAVRSGPEAPPTLLASSRRLYCMQQGGYAKPVYQESATTQVLLYGYASTRLA